MVTWQSIIWYVDCPKEPEKSETKKNSAQINIIKLCQFVHRVAILPSFGRHSKINLIINNLFHETG